MMWPVRERERFIMRAVGSRYQKYVDEGYRVMAWRMAGTLDQDNGEFFRS
jgi:hypothetical protein